MQSTNLSVSHKRPKVGDVIASGINAHHFSIDLIRAARDLTRQPEYPREQLDLTDILLTVANNILDNQNDVDNLIEWFTGLAYEFDSLPAYTRLEYGNSILKRIYTGSKLVIVPDIESARTLPQVEFIPLANVKGLEYLLQVNRQGYKLYRWVPMIFGHAWQEVWRFDN